jgi:hypothetical protein
VDQLGPLVAKGTDHVLMFGLARRLTHTLIDGLSAQIQLLAAKVPCFGVPMPEFVDLQIWTVLVPALASRIP